MDTNATVEEVLLSTKVSPSGGLSVGTVARSATSRLQLFRKAVPELLPYGLSRESQRLHATHPCMRPATLPPYGSLALRSQPRDPQECNAKRFAVVRALEELKGTTRRGDLLFCSACECVVAARTEPESSRFHARTHVPHRYTRPLFPCRFCHGQAKTWRRQPVEENDHVRQNRTILHGPSRRLTVGHT